MGQKAEPTIAPDRIAAAGGSFSGAVRNMFDGLAPRYDAFNHWASLGLDYGWRRATVRSLQLAADAAVLDIATGTGDLAFATARHARHTIGCDFAAEMVSLARHKAGDTNHVQFQVARAEQLPYRADRFDGVTSAFAMRNVKPLVADVLSEAYRVLRPGGRVAILEFSRPRFAAVRLPHGVYTRVVMPRVGRWLTGTAEPFEYLYRSIQQWDTPEEFARRLCDTGFSDVRYRMMGMGTVALHVGCKPS